ncbi:MAG: hypothetical protein HY000_08625 [Planctomycetes bacterium]|nr:hypothetical protein [Planctomycetota bacterium]
MRQHLIGYLLDALDGDEREQVEAMLRSEPTLARDLQLLKLCFHPLEADRGHYEASPGLAGRTCRFVAARQTARAATVVSGTTSSWRWQDLLVAAGIFVAASLLFFPAVSQSRHLAQRAGCESNLRQVGVALTQYSEVNRDHFPQIPQHGPLGVAGIYAPVLVEMGFLDDSRWLVCPASTLAGRGSFTVPTQAQLLRATREERQRLYRELGGSYGFPLGYLADGAYHGVKNLRRSTYALVSDTPELADTDHCSPNHGRCGQNVLWEDGHVSFLRTCTNEPAKDHIFANQEGKVAPGIGPDDAVIGPSHVAPATVLPVSHPGEALAR